MATAFQIPACDVSVALSIRLFDASEATLNHELNCLIHIGGNHSLTRMGCGPDTQQFINESLTDVCYAAEVNVNSVKSASSP